MLLTGAVVPAAAGLSAETLSEEIAVYRTAADRGVSPETRERILDGLQERYRDAGIDTAPVDEERRKLVVLRSYASAAGSVGAIVTDISADTTRIEVTAGGVTRTNCFLLMAPESGTPPSVVFDLYGVSGLPDGTERSEFADGPVSVVTAEAIAPSPATRAVRIIAGLRRESLYRVVREGEDRWVVLIGEERLPARTETRAAAAVPTETGMTPEETDADFPSDGETAGPVSPPDLPFASGPDTVDTAPLSPTERPWLTETDLRTTAHAAEDMPDTLHRTLPWAGLLALLTVIATGL